MTQHVSALQAVSLLARSVKEHARRNGETLGFSEAPGDCLAFTYYRDVRPDGCRTRVAFASCDRAHLVA